MKKIIWNHLNKIIFILVPILLFGCTTPTFNQDNNTINNSNKQIVNNNNQQEKKLEPSPNAVVAKPQQLKLDDENIPEEIKNWTSKLKILEGGFIKNINNESYLLFNLGKTEQNIEIEISAINEVDGKTVVYLNLQNVKEKKDTINYPQALTKITKKNKPVIFTYKVDDNTMIFPAQEINTQFSDFFNQYYLTNKRNNLLVWKNDLRTGDFYGVARNIKEIKYRLLDEKGKLSEEKSIPLNTTENIWNEWQINLTNIDHAKPYLLEIYYLDTYSKEKADFVVFPILPENIKLSKNGFQPTFSNFPLGTPIEEWEKKLEKPDEKYFLNNNSDQYSLGNTEEKWVYNKEHLSLNFTHTIDNKINLTGVYCTTSKYDLGKTLKVSDPIGKLIITLGEPDGLIGNQLIYLKDNIKITFSFVDGIITAIEVRY